MLNLRTQAMPHLFRIKPNLTEAQWKVVLAPIRSKVPGVRPFKWVRNDMLLVNGSIELLTPVRGWAKAWSVEALAANYTPVAWV